MTPEERFDRLDTTASQTEAGLPGPKRVLPAQKQTLREPKRPSAVPFA